jgi:pimeloyl-ACP methyl ester carboxylesterase
VGQQPETQYAKSGSVNIAYQVVGEGSSDLILVPGFVSHVEVAWEEPRLAHFLHRLASFSRLIVFDKRGTGMSDPVASPPSMDERMDDIRAVMDAVGSAKGTIFGISEGGTLSLLFSLAHPERTGGVILYGSLVGAAPVRTGLSLRSLGRAAGRSGQRDGPGLGVRRVVGWRPAKPCRRCTAPQVVGALPADGSEPVDGAERHPDEHADGCP